MSNVNYNFSFSYQVKPTKLETPDLYAFDDCTDFPLPHRQSLVRSRRTSNQAVLTAEALHALRQCISFAPMDEHIKAIGREIPELKEHEDDIRSVLNGARQAGLLVSAAEFLKPLSPEAGAKSGIPACYCILTCDRPTALERLLTSIHDNHAFDPDRNRYWVVDDSREPQNQQQNRRIVTRFREERHLAFHYFGREEQRGFIRKLKEQLDEAHHAGVDFLLSAEVAPGLPSYGRNRNWGLLLGAGLKIVLLDDDILFERRIPKFASGKVMLGRHHREAAFFSSPDDWKQTELHPQPDPTDGTALALIGETLPRALHLLGIEKPTPRMLRGCHTTMLAALSPQSRLLMTSCGSLGDPGTSSNHWLFELESDSRTRLFADEAGYRRNITERNCWVGSPEFRLLPPFSVMSAVTTLDGNTELPPYFPFLRNEDLLFGSMLQQLHPHGLLIDCPWAVPHIPLETRKWDKEKLFVPARPGFLWFTNAMLNKHCTKLALAIEDRLSQFSSIFHALAELSNEALSLSLSEQTALERSARIHKLTNCLDEAGARAPKYWRQDMVAIIRANQEGLIAPLEIKGFPDLQKASSQPMQGARMLWRGFATALGSWPAIIEAAEILGGLPKDHRSAVEGD